MPTRNLMIIGISTVLSIFCYFKAERNRYAATVAEAMHKVRTYYVEDVDTRELFESAMEGMVKDLDQYSNYIGPEMFQRMEEDLDQEFGGVGIEIDKPDDETTLMVLSPLVGTPAARAGLRPGDEILSIDGLATAGLPNKEAVQKMRGKPGSKVRLEVLRPGKRQPFEVTIVREVIQVQSVLGDSRRANGSWDYRLSENPRIAYLRIIGFGQHTVSELKTILKQPRDLPFEAGLIDLRGNSGGLLSAAVEMCDLFIDEGVIVSTRGRDRLVRDRFDAQADMVVPKSFHLAILVDHDSASASEIVAACLQDHERALVVGERTWGKGTVQNIFEMEGGRSALKLTTASYWRPSGRNIHRGREEDESGDWGVRPNAGFEIKLTNAEKTQKMLQRRRRDVEHGLKFRPDAIRLAEPVDEARLPPVSPDGSTPGTAGVNEAQEFEDTQLRRAIEYLEEQLGRPTATRQAA